MLPEGKKEEKERKREREKVQPTAVVKREEKKGGESVSKDGDAESLL